MEYKSTYRYSMMFAYIAMICSFLLFLRSLFNVVNVFQQIDVNNYDNLLDFFEVIFYYLFDLIIYATTCLALFSGKRNMVLAWLYIAMIAYSIYFGNNLDVFSLSKFFSILSMITVVVYIILAVQRRYISQGFMRIFCFVPFILDLISSIIVMIEYDLFIGTISEYTIRYNLNLTADKCLLLFTCLWFSPYTKIIKDVPVQQQNLGYISMSKHIMGLLFTFGIWICMWIYKTTKLLNGFETKQEKMRSPINQLLLIIFIPFYYIYWIYVTLKIVDKIAVKNGRQSEFDPLHMFIAIFVPLFSMIVIQNSINSNASIIVWQKYKKTNENKEEQCIEDNEKEELMYEDYTKNS